jgi:hypothetical protein
LAFLGVKMGRLKGRLANMKKAREAKVLKIRRRSMDKGSSRAGSFAGASDASFLSPLSPQQSDRRLSLPRRPFDSSFVQRKRRQPPKRAPGHEDGHKFVACLCPRPHLAWSGPIQPFSLKSEKMQCPNSYKRLRLRLRARRTARRSSSHRRRKKSLR